MQLEISRLREVSNPLKKGDTSQQDGFNGYHTDEEELERENWVLEKNKRPSKKRRADSKPQLSLEKETGKGLSKVGNLKASKQSGTKDKEQSPPPINIVVQLHRSAIIMKSITTNE